MDNQPFVHLHVHSQFSLLDGQASVKGLVDKAIKDGMSGIALTDHGAMFGIKEFYDYVSKKNAPLLGERKDLKKQISALEGQEARTPLPLQEGGQRPQPLSPHPVNRQQRLAPRPAG